MKEYTVAVAGATGVVGQEMVKVLKERSFPVKRLVPLASERSVGKEVEFKEKRIKVELLDKNAFENIDIALFSAGSEVSKKIAPFAARAGAVVIDNSSAFRMDEGVPLVVPEVNPEDAYKHKGIIANPNCSTIQMVVALKPIQEAFGIKRIVVSTYQSVSGWGKGAIDQLWEEIDEIAERKSPLTQGETKALPHQMAFNLFPHIDVFLENGYTKEELKMVNETRKIMHDESLKITATCVRVPVLISHSEAINIELKNKASVDEIKELLSNSEGIKVEDDTAGNIYPMPLYASGKDEVFVGRIRQDLTVENGIWLWVVSDNLRKGAALNAVQIAELLINHR